MIRWSQVGTSLALVLAMACSREPAPIVYGEDTCGYCRMEITDPRFGGTVVSATGRQHDFDSIECLAEFVGALRDTTSWDIWVHDYANPGRRIAARDAIFARVDGIRSPMGRELLALGTAEDAARLARGTARRASPLRWTDVLATRGEDHRPETHLAAADSNSTVPRGTAAADVVVDPAGPVRTIGEAVAIVRRGGRIVIRRGIYREPTIVVRRPMEIAGDSGAVLDGDGTRALVLVRSSDVAIRGLTFRNTGASFAEDRAAIRIEEAERCTVADNVFDKTFFAIYLAKVTGCRIERNRMHASFGGESESGNGVHAWNSRQLTVVDNRISGHRDGIYFEFVHESEVRGNTSERNSRYGLHFMYSNDCHYVGNTFRANGSGVAVMYTRRVEMIGNRFEANRGTAAYGLLLKEIADSRIEQNLFQGNTIALLADGADRLQASGNEFSGNGWAVKLEGSTVDGRFERNRFVTNTFDVATASRSPSTVFNGNYWDDYRGYDLDRDGVGDVPHRPIRLFSMLIEKNEPSVVLMRSSLSSLLDLAERALPVLTPETLVDTAPVMERGR